VSISSGKVTDGALAHIAAFPGLELLEIHAGSSLTASSLRKFREARPHVHVYARGEALLGVHADPEGPCLLTEVVPGSAAEQAGLRTGDEVIAAAGAHIRDFSDLTIAVFSHKPGDKLAIEFNRGGKRQVVEVALTKRQPLEIAGR
jgi:S1-C subfamily serine protease